MIVDSLITGVQKYFSTLSVDSIFGDSKVSLILAESGGIYSGRQVSIFRDDELFSENVLELDATESVTVNTSKRTLKHESESHQVFIDGTKVDPTRITVVAHIDSTKMGVLEKFSQPNAWMYFLHTKSMGGSIPELGYYTDAKLYHILTVVSTDIGYKNTIKVQIELEEVLLYERQIASKYKVKQTNKVSGDGTAVSKGGDKTFKDHFESGTDLVLSIFR